MFTIERFNDMQVLKEDIRLRILSVAREEFIANGVRDTSIRTIASKAGIAVGNIYKYFESKNELFRAVLEPLLTRIDQYIISHNDENFLNLEVFKEHSFSTIHMQELLEMIRNYRPELRLLLFDSQGTTLEGYLDRMTQMQVEVGYEYMWIMKERFPHLNTNISPHLVRVLASTWSNLVSDLVEHEEYSDEEINETVDQYSRYVMGGWKELMKPF